MDTEAYCDGDPSRRALVDDGGARALLAVPLRKDDVLLGMIAIFRQEPGAFTGKQIALLENFAAQAVIAMENARLLTETREALEQQTATAEVLQVINASPGDLMPVLDAMLEKALRLCGGTIGGIFTIERNRSVTRALQGVTPAFAAFQEQYPIDEIQPGTVPARIIDTGRPVQNPDVKAGETYRNGVPYARALVDLGNIRAVLAVPLLKDGVAVGMIALYREEPGAFADKQVALLENFAAQAVIAMENARLLGELRDRTAELAERNTAFAERIDHQAATIDVLKAMSASPGDPQPVFDLIVQRARDLCHAYGVTVLEFDGELLHQRASTGVSEDPEVREALTAMYPQPPTRDMPNGRAVLDRKIIRMDDYEAEHGLNPIYRDITARSGVFIPLMRGDSVVGTVGMGSREKGGFSASQVELLKTFAEQAAIAITSAETYRALQTRTGDLQESLEQQTATTEVLEIINASPGDLAPVFDAVLERALRLSGAYGGGVFTVHDMRLKYFAFRGMPDAFTMLRLNNELPI